MKFQISGIRKPFALRLAALEKASGDIIPILTSDVQIFCARIDRDKFDSTSARAAVRFYFSEIEAIVYFMRELSAILHEIDKFRGKLSNDEKEQLIGKPCELKRGKLKKPAPPRLKFLNRVKFALNIYSKIHDIGYRIDYESKGWQKFVIASKIRDRLTHPSRIGDVNLSREDFDTVALASQWFTEQQKEIDRLKHEKYPGGEEKDSSQ